MRFLTVDQPSQLANPAAFAKAPGETQHHHLLSQRIALCITGHKTTALQRLAADVLQPRLGRR
ncbi:hypothetical protein D3C79_1067700 [compost metagenome]